jgi:hypothetical protein
MLKSIVLCELEILSLVKDLKIEGNAVEFDYVFSFI